MNDVLVPAPHEPLDRRHSGRVYVLGHQNPDTDSICSAIAYAALRRATDLPGAIPARLGPLWAETEYALERFGVPAPMLLTDVRQRVSDVMMAQAVTIRESASLYEAATLMRDARVHLVPVVDGNERLLGVLSVDDIAARYLDDALVETERHRAMPFERYVRALGGELLQGDATRGGAGRIAIAAMSAAALGARVGPGDTVIVGNRADAQEAALRAGAACLIVVGDEPVSDRVLALASERQVIVLRSPYDSYGTARLLSLSLPVAEVMRAPGATLDPDDLASDVASTLLTAGRRALIVVNDARRVVGIVSRSDILRGRRKQVLLVDHNQRSQAVAGIDEADLLGVVDHHNLGDLRTAEPIHFTLEPVGSTATIVSELFARASLAPDVPIAGLLAAAIISDTLQLTSPTTTPRDEAALGLMAARAGIEPAELARELFRARSDFNATTPRALLAGNLKSYQFGDARLAIGQAETLDTAYFLARQEEFRAELERVKAEGVDYAFFLVTDIVHGASVVFYPGQLERRLLVKAFGLAEAGEEATTLPGVVSRKKQVVPPLARALG